VEDIISKLQTFVDTAGQRLLEGAKARNPVVVGDENVFGCYGDCQDILVFLKLKCEGLFFVLLL
jgi:hypothetical protein